MPIATGLMVFFIVWWTVLFAVLPWGIKRDESTGQIGAPLKPMLFKKVMITTVLTVIIWLIIYYIASQPDLLSFRNMAKEVPLQ